MITNLKNEDSITVNIFGRDKTVRVISTGDNCFDENGSYKKDNFELNSKEINILNWLINNIKLENYLTEIVYYCNNTYAMWSDKKVNPEDFENEVNIDSIVINITEKNNPAYPEIAFCGRCKCDEEHGICIGFRDEKLLGIQSEDWIF